MLVPTRLPDELIDRNPQKAWRKTTFPVLWLGELLPIGTEYLAFESANFGWVILKEPVQGRRSLKV